MVEIVRGGSPRPIKDYLTSEVDGINWIKIGDTEKGEKYINNVKEKIKKSGLNKTRFVKKGTFLLTNSMSFGRPYILNVDGAIHDGWLAISNYENSLNKDYLFYILSSNVVYSQFLSLISGAVVKNLNSDKVASILIPLPPLSEQQRIVEAIESALEKVDEYAESYNRLEQLDKKFPEKRKYSSHKGDVGKKAENLIQGQFEGSKTMEQCYTDVTEFTIPVSTQKLYLSPVLDGFNSEIIAYNLSTSPNLEQVQTMLEQAFTEKHYENTILHSDQGWQYQHDSYHQFLEGKGIQASMSRKGNSPDNGMMESFFGILKSEMFYGYEKSFQSLKQLEQAIVDYIDYYNNKRIKVKLKGLSPVQYRTKSFG
ncbi:IS3-Spn1 transposase, truncation [Streptococcus pneumoniae]|nr:IS3-Spn1 transposase, truncation [Streptococcus pneumoniae]